MVNNMWKLYELIKGLSILIRQFALPNPFVGFENADALNLLVGVILYPVTYLIVKLYYKARSNPAWGSFLYLFFYISNTFLIALAGVFKFTKISIIVIALLYGFLLGVIKWLQLKLSWGSY